MKKKTEKTIKMYRRIWDCPDIPENEILMIDPPEGWKYGFPKKVPFTVTEEKTINEWLIEVGYPKERIEYYGMYFYCRMWYEEKRKN
jgi:hypothetical protein